MMWNVEICSASVYTDVISIRVAVIEIVLIGVEHHGDTVEDPEKSHAAGPFSHRGASGRAVLDNEGDAVAAAAVVVEMAGWIGHAETEVDLEGIGDVVPARGPCGAGRCWAVQVRIEIRSET